MQTAVNRFPSSKRGRPPGSITAGTKTPNLTDVHVGKQIKNRRIMLGVSQTDLADNVGITFQQIQKYESGTNRVSASRLQAIAIYLGVQVGWFFNNLPGEISVKAGDTTKEANDVTGFLSSVEGRELNQHFQKITDPKVRKTFVALVKTLADKGANDK